MTAQHTPMEIKAARALCDRAADACGIDRNDNWNVYAEDFKADAKAMLDACGAPDLLETLSKTLKRIEEALAYGYLPAGTEQELETQAAEIRAAIAKATGAA
jgi:hypothetical protein